MSEPGHELHTDERAASRLLMAYADGIAGRSLALSAMGTAPPRPVEYLDAVTSPAKRDVFVSYSSDDRDAWVLPFVTALRHHDLHAWFDVQEIAWGDSITEKVQQGLSSASFVVAFISEPYLQKPWPRKELRAALTSEIMDRVPILPVLLGVSPQSLSARFPFLAETKHVYIDPRSPQAPDAAQTLVDKLIEAKRRRERIHVQQHVSVGHRQLRQAVYVLRLHGPPGCVSLLLTSKKGVKCLRTRARLR